MERYRLKNDGLATDTSIDQEECESSCGLFFFPLLELPLNQQLQLQQLSFINTNLEVRCESVKKRFNLVLTIRLLCHTAAFNA